MDIGKNVIIVTGSSGLIGRAFNNRAGESIRMASFADIGPPHSPVNARSRVLTLLPTNCARRRP